MCTFIYTDNITTCSILTNTISLVKWLLIHEHIQHKNYSLLNTSKLKSKQHRKVVTEGNQCALDKLYSTCKNMNLKIMAPDMRLYHGGHDPLVVFKVVKNHAHQLVEEAVISKENTLTILYFYNSYSWNRPTCVLQNIY